MNLIKKWPLLFLLSTLTGCGGSSDQVVGGSSSLPTTLPAPVTAEDALRLAKIRNPQLAVKLVPREHLDKVALPTLKGEVGAAAVTNLTVQQLELSYDTVFGSLSQSLGVTNSTRQVQQDINYIASQADTGYFNLNQEPIQNNPLGVTGVSFQPVTYNTTVALPGGPQTFAVSGGLVMPQGLSPQSLKGVVVFFHGTTSDNAEVPSQLSSEFQLAAEVFGSQGYIVVGPDYIGQGVNAGTVHPYVLYPAVSAQTAVDLLNAAQPLIASQFGPQPLKLFSTGYSEGGAYAVWFNSVVSAGSNLSSFYKFTHAVGLEGAYSASNVTYNFLFDEVSKDEGNPFKIQDGLLLDVVKPILLADALLSYATYSLSSQFTSVFFGPFFSMTATGVNQSDCNINGQQLTIAQAYALPDGNIVKQLVYSALNKSNNGQTYAGEVGLFFGSKANSGKALVSSTLLGSGLSNLQSTLAAADVNLSGVPDDSVSLITLDEDSVVSPNNFDWLLGQYPAKIKNAITIDHTQLKAVSLLSEGSASWQDVDHQSALPFEFLYALHIFNSL